MARSPLWWQGSQSQLCHTGCRDPRFVAAPHVCMGWEVQSWLDLVLAARVVQLGTRALQLIGLLVLAAHVGRCCRTLGPKCQCGTAGTKSSLSKGSFQPWVPASCWFRGSPRSGSPYTSNKSPSHGGAWSIPWPGDHNGWEIIAVTVSQP